MCHWLAKTTFREEIKRGQSHTKSVLKLALWKHGSNDWRPSGISPLAWMHGQCASTHNRHAMECHQEIRAVRRALLLPLKKEPMVLRELVRFGPSILVEAVKACALIGLHMMIEETSGRSENGSSVSSIGSDENNVGNDEMFVIGATWIPRHNCPSYKPSGKKIEYSSSSWSITSRRRWCD